MLTILLILLGLVFLLVLSPIHFRLKSDLHEDETEIYAKVSVYFGLIQVEIVTELENLRFWIIFAGIRIPVYRKAIKEIRLDSGKSQAEKKKPQKKKPKKKSKPSSSKLKVVDWFKIARQALPRLFKPVRFRQFECDLTIGLSDPAATGMLLSVYYMFKYTIDALRQVELKGDFEKKGIRGKIACDIFIHLVQYISILIFVYRLYRQQRQNK